VRRGKRFCTRLGFFKPIDHSPSLRSQKSHMFILSLCLQIKSVTHTLWPSEVLSALIWPVVFSRRFPVLCTYFLLTWIWRSHLPNRFLYSGKSACYVAVEINTIKLCYMWIWLLLCLLWENSSILAPSCQKYNYYNYFAKPRNILLVWLVEYFVSWYMV